MRRLLQLFNLFPLGLRKRVIVAIALLRRAMTLGVRLVVRDEQGRVLLVRHTYVPGWHLPGGGVERGETFLQAAEKELLEEAGVVAEAPLRLFHIYRNLRTSRFDHVALYTCPRWRQEQPKKPDHEIAEHGFFSLDDLPRETTLSTRDRLAELFDDQSVSDIW